MEFLSSCSPRHPTRSLRSFVSYRVDHSKRNSISTRAHVLFSTLILQLENILYIHIYILFLILKVMNDAFVFHIKRKIPFFVIVCESLCMLTLITRMNFKQIKIKPPVYYLSFINSRSSQCLPHIALIQLYFVESKSDRPIARQLKMSISTVSYTPSKNWKTRQPSFFYYLIFWVCTE